MRQAMTLLASGMLATTLLAGCSDNNNPTGPSNGGNGGGTSGGGTGSPPPATASVILGDIFFESDQNGTRNPAVDTVAVNGTVAWIWGSSASMAHSVHSEGAPGFASSSILSGVGSTHQATLRRRVPTSTTARFTGN